MSMVVVLSFGWFVTVTGICNVIGVRKVSNLSSLDTPGKCVNSSMKELPLPGWLTGTPVDIFLIANWCGRSQPTVGDVTPGSWVRLCRNDS